MTNDISIFLIFAFTHLALVCELRRIDAEDLEVVDEGDLLVARPLSDAQLDAVQLALVGGRRQAGELEGVAGRHFGLGNYTFKGL